MRETLIQLITDVLDEIAIYQHLKTVTDKEKAIQTIKICLNGFVISSDPNKAETYINNSKILITSTKGSAKGKLKAIQINLENALTELI